MGCFICRRCDWRVDWRRLAVAHGLDVGKTSRHRSDGPGRREDDVYGRRLSWLATDDSDDLCRRVVWLRYWHLVDGPARPDETCRCFCLLESFSDSAPLRHCFSARRWSNGTRAIPVTYGKIDFQSGLTMLTGLFLLAVLFAILLYAAHTGNSGRAWSNPARCVHRDPARQFVVHFVCSALAARPYQQLVGEAQRASVAAPHKSQDEAEFVLETFQSVVAQLQEQRTELEQLSAEARERANSAEKFSERIVASLPSGLIAFDGAGLSMAINTPGRALLEVDGERLESRTNNSSVMKSWRRWLGTVCKRELFIAGQRSKRQCRRKAAPAWRNRRSDRAAAGAWTTRRAVSADRHHRSDGTPRAGGVEEQS